MVSPNKHGYSVALTCIILILNIACQSESDGNKSHIHQFLKDKQEVFVINEINLSSSFSDKESERVLFTGIVERNETVDSLNNTKTNPILLQVQHEDNITKLPLDNIYFSRPISNSLFVYFFNRIPTIKETRLLADLTHHYNQLINVSSNVYKSFQRTKKLQEQLLDLSILESKDMNDDVYTYFWRYLPGIEKIGLDTSIYCLHISYWQKLSKRTIDKDDDAYFELLDQVYTDQIACSFTTYQIPNVTFSHTCSKLGSFTHYRLLKLIHQQIKNRSIFKKYLIQLHKDIVDDMTTNKQLWFTSEQAIIELDSILIDSSIRISTEQKIECMTRRDHLKNPTNFGIVDRQYEG